MRKLLSFSTIFAISMTLGLVMVVDSIFAQDKVVTKEPKPVPPLQEIVVLGDQGYRKKFDLTKNKFWFEGANVLVIVDKETGNPVAAFSGTWNAEFKW